MTWLSLFNQMFKALLCHHVAASVISIHCLLLLSYGAQLASASVKLSGVVCLPLGHMSPAVSISSSVDCRYSAVCFSLKQWNNFNVPPSEGTVFLHIYKYCALLSFLFRYWIRGWHTTLAFRHAWAYCVVKCTRKHKHMAMIWHFYITSNICTLL